MIKLFKLELSKMRLGWYMNSAVIASILIVGLVCTIIYVEQSEGNIAIASMEEAAIILGAFVRSTFVVMAAVLISKLIIEEYKNKTIQVLFLYPISRKKLFTVKLALIASVTFIAILISHMVVLAAFVAINSWLKLVPQGLDTFNYFDQLPSIAIFSLSTAIMSLIPLYFGMRKHSVPATILSSLIIIAITGSYNSVFTLANIVYIPIGLAVLGLAVAYWSICRLDEQDLQV